MVMSYEQVWQQFSHVSFKRRIYIKRLKEDGSYEADFTEISDGQMKDGSVNSISRSLPNNSWEFGRVNVSNVRLEILSAFQEFAAETDPNSIFSGFIRHRSIVKIVDALIDKYTDPNEPAEASVTTFIGLIDSLTATTEQGYETVTALDFLSVLDEINVKELTLVQTTLSSLVYEIINRSEFTKFFSVSNSTVYINPGYNATNIDVSVYDGSVLEMLEDLAKGHSIFYIDPDDNYFYFKPADPTATVQYSFLEENNRKLEISSFREGVDRQITNWYWADLEEFLQGDWTSVDWTGSSSSGWEHTTGNTSVLSEPTPAVNAKQYIISYTVKDRTAGTFSLSFGGYSASGISANGKVSITTSSTANLQITPTSDFDGAIIISIKSDIKAIKNPAPVNPRSSTFKIDGIKDDAQRQATLNAVLERSQDAKPYFKLDLPYFPVIKILDKVEVQSFGSAPRDAVRWGMFLWTDKDTADPLTAPRWRKPAGIRISQDDKWLVRSISHDKNLRTTLELEKIV